MRTLYAGVTAAAILFSSVAQAADVHLLNVSYDPTRELYKDINAAFAADWKAKTGEKVNIEAQLVEIVRPPFRHPHTLLSMGAAGIGTANGANRWA